MCILPGREHFSTSYLSLLTSYSHFIRTTSPEDQSPRASTRHPGPGASCVFPAVQSGNESPFNGQGPGSGAVVPPDTVFSVPRRNRCHCHGDWVLPRAMQTALSQDKELLFR